MSWKTVYRDKIEKIRLITDDAINRLNRTSDPAEQATIAIEAIDAISREVSPD